MSFGKIYFIEGRIFHISNLNHIFETTFETNLQIYLSYLLSLEYQNKFSFEKLYKLTKVIEYFTFHKNVNVLCNNDSFKIFR